MWARKGNPWWTQKSFKVLLPNTKSAAWKELLEEQAILLYLWMFWCGTTANRVNFAGMPSNGNHKKMFCFACALDHCVARPCFFGKNTTGSIWVTVHSHFKAIRDSGSKTWRNSATSVFFFILSPENLLRVQEAGNTLSSSACNLVNLSNCPHGIDLKIFLPKVLTKIVCDCFYFSILAEPARKRNEVGVETVCYHHAALPNIQQVPFLTFMCCWMCCWISHLHLFVFEGRQYAPCNLEAMERVNWMPGKSPNLCMESYHLLTHM